MDKIKVFIVDDHALVRDGIISMLSNLKDIQVVGESADGFGAIEKVDDKNIDVIILDVIMPGINGIEAAKAIKKKHPALKILFLSMEVSEKNVSDALKAGGNGYLLKDSSKQVLVEAIRSLHEGNQYFSPSIAQMVFNNFIKRTSSEKVASEEDRQDLSEREKEVLTLICKGLNHKDIGEKLFISSRTVDTHRTNILKKLNLDTTAELVLYAVKKRLVVLD